MSETDFSTDQYSKSLFVIEVDGTPTVIFKNKRHAEAELICQTWKNNHWEQLLIEGRGKLKFPPLIKLRLAHHHEITAYAAENAQVEIFD
jgi:hypothetical protein